jgi:hypothetical protein
VVNVDKRVECTAYGISFGSSGNCVPGELIDLEKIDLSPVLLFGLAGVMMLRYIARGIESQSLYMLSSIGMGES